MIISAPTDFRRAAQRRLPPFLFHYIDGGSGAETTLRRNEADLQQLMVRQNVLRDVEGLSTATTLFGEDMALPVVLAPVGLTGMYARRGEVQAARAAAAAGCRSRCPPSRSARWRKSRRPARARSGSSSMCSRIAASCATCWSGPRRRGSRPWCSPWTCPCPARAIAMRIPACLAPMPRSAAWSRRQRILAGHGTWACAAARTIWAISRTTWASRWRWATTSAGWAPISIRRSAGRIWNGSARSGMGR
jgi:hypothetical protein